MITEFLSNFSSFWLVGIAVVLLYKGSGTFQLTAVAISSALILLYRATAPVLSPLIALFLSLLLSFGIGYGISRLFVALRHLYTGEHQQTHALVFFDVALFSVIAGIIGTTYGHSPIDQGLFLPTFDQVALSLFGIAIAVAYFFISERRSFDNMLELMFWDQRFFTTLASTIGYSQTRLRNAALSIAYPLFFLSIFIFAVPTATQIRVHDVLELYTMGLAFCFLAKRRATFLFFWVLGTAFCKVFCLSFVTIVPPHFLPVLLFLILGLTETRRHWKFYFRRT